LDKKIGRRQVLTAIISATWEMVESWFEVSLWKKLLRPISNTWHIPEIPATQRYEEKDHSQVAQSKV
jgi:hypothetical protein